MRPREIISAASKLAVRLLDEDRCKVFRVVRANKLLFWVGARKKKKKTEKSAFPVHYYQRECDTVRYGVDICRYIVMK
jgi:hypothetical protein